MTDFLIVNSCKTTSYGLAPRSLNSTTQTYATFIHFLFVHSIGKGMHCDNMTPLQCHTGSYHSIS